MKSSFFNDDIEALKKYYRELSPFSRFFFPNALKQALLNPDAHNLTIIHHAFHSVWFFHRWFFKALRHFFKSEDIRSTEWLFKLKPYSQSSALYDLQQLPESQTIITLLCQINKTTKCDLYQGQRNLRLLREHPNKSSLTRALLLLNEHQCFNTQNAQRLYLSLLHYRSTRSNLPVDGLVSLFNDVGFLSLIPNPLIVALEHHHANWVERSLFLLNGMGLFHRERETSHNITLFQTLLASRYPEILYQLLSHLHRLNLRDPLLTQNYLNVLLLHQRPRALHRILSATQDVGLLSTDRGEANFVAIISHPYPENLARAFHTLSLSIDLDLANSSELQTQFNTLIEADDPESVAMSLQNSSPFHHIASLFSFSTNGRGSSRTVPSLRSIAQNRESAMRTLSASEQRHLDAAIRHYRPKIREQGGLDACFERLLQSLKEKYQQNPACARSRPFSSTQERLPLSWDDFQSLNLPRGESREHALKAYYQHKTHTALRFLSLQNPWRHANAYPPGGFRYFKEHIVILWLAASDRTMEPTNGYTLDGRIQHYIHELAHIGRAHNWDNTRIKRDAQGNICYDKQNNSIEEEYDDNEGDKVSCISGINTRLYQAIQGHPLFSGLTRTILQHELRDFIIAHFRRCITPSNQAILHEAWNDLIISGANDSNHRQLQLLNIPINKQTEFTTYLNQKYSDYRTSTDLHEYIRQQFALDHTFPTHAERFGGPQSADLTTLLSTPQPSKRPGVLQQCLSLFNPQNKSSLTALDSASQTQHQDHESLLIPQ